MNLTLPDDEPRLPDKVQCLAHQVQASGNLPLPEHRLTKQFFYCGLAPGVAQRSETLKGLVSEEHGGGNVAGRQIVAGLGVKQPGMLMVGHAELCGDVQPLFGMLQSFLVTLRQGEVQGRLHMRYGQ